MANLHPLNGVLSAGTDFESGSLSMYKNIKAVAAFIAIVSIALPFAANPKKRRQTRNQRNETPQNEPKILWRKPADISARDLFYGPGGKKDQPGITYTFLKEDLKMNLCGTSWRGRALSIASD